MKRESYPFSWTWIIGVILLLASASVTAQIVIDGEFPIEAENWWAVNPTSHDYGDLLVNTEAYQTFTLINFSGDEVEVTPSISDSGRGFTLGDHDCTRLQPESSCRVEVRYSPATAATHTTSLTFSLARFAVDASVPLVEEAQIPLSGRGITPAATPPAFAPQTLDFGEVAIGGWRAESTTLTNSDPNHTLFIQEIVLEGAAQGFAIDVNHCGEILEPGQSCTLHLSLSPSSGGPLQGALVLFGFQEPAHTATRSLRRSRATPQELARATLQGSGVAPSASVTLTPSELNFGSIAVGESSRQTLTLANSNDVHPMQLQPASLEGDGFRIEQTTCGTTLEAEQSCTFTLLFEPSRITPYGATLSVAWSDGYASTNHGTVSATLQGEGRAPLTLPPLLPEITPNPVEFGTLPLATTASASATLTNRDPRHYLAIEQLTLEGEAAGFHFSQHDCGSYLPPNHSCTLQLAFTPSAVGWAEGAVVLVGGLFMDEIRAATANELARATLQGYGEAYLPPITANDDHAETPAETPITLAVLANDQGVELTLTSVTTPANGSAAIENQQIRYTPAPGFAGSDRFRYTISDHHGQSASAQVTITVEPPPLTANDDQATTPAATPVTLAVLANDQGAELTLVSVTAPAHGSAVIEEQQIRYTPAPGFAGSDRFHYSVSDRYGQSASAQVTITVEPPPLTANDDQATTPAATPVTLAVLANDQGEGLTLVSVTAPAHGSAVIENQQIRYTPAPGFAGNDSFRYTLSDHYGQSASAQVSITVQPPGLTARDDQAETPAETPVTIAVLANDNGEGVALIRVTPPAHGSAVIDNQQIRYTPAPGFAGNDSFHYSISDRYGQSTSARVQVTVIAPELHARDDHAETPANTTMTLAVLDNDSGEGITITQLTSPQHGSVTHLGDETLHYTPALNFAGEDHFSYTIGDRYGQSASARVTLRVVAPQLQAIDDSAAAHSNTPVAIPVLANDIGQSITISEITSPQHGSATLQQDGTILYTSVALYSGSDSFRYTISDGISSDSAQVTVQVTPSREELEELLEQSSDDPDASRLGGSIARLCFDGSGSAHFQRDCEALIAAALERHQRGPGEPPLHPDDSDIGTILEQITPRSFRYPSETTVATAQAQMSGIQSRLSLLRSGTIMGIDIERLRIQRGGWAFTGQDLHDFLLASTGNVSSPPPPDSDEPPPFGLFIGGTIHLGDRDPGAVSGGYTSRALDLMIGGDYRISDPVVVGGALHYSESDTNYRQQEGQLDTRGYGLTLYSAYYPSDPIYLEGIIHYGTNRYDQQRNLSYRLNGDEIAQRFDSNYQGRQLFAEVGGGYEFTHGNLTFGPDARLGYLAVHTNRFQEQAANPGPGSGWAMALDRQRQQQQMLNLGVRASYLIEQPWGLLRPNAELTWQQHLDDRNNDTLNGYFVEGGNSPDNRFTFHNDSSERDNALRLGLGVNARLNNGASLHLRYRTLLGHDRGNQQSLSAQIRWNF